MKKLYYYKYPNIGDMLNELLPKDLFGTPSELEQFPEADYVAIGSILDKLITDSRIGKQDKERQEVANKEKTLTVWGTGFMYDYTGSDHSFIRPVDIRALRGELSRQQASRFLQKEVKCVLADPGLLASFLCPAGEKKYEVGLIPHYVDAANEVFAEMMDYYDSAVLINVKDDPMTVLKTISECRTVLSTSLHGLIIADSYGIPNQWCECSDKILGEGYKYRDYYSSFGLPAKKFSLDHGVFPDLEEVKHSYLIQKRMVRKKQRELILSFPYDTKEKYKSLIQFFWRLCGIII